MRVIIEPNGGQVSAWGAAYIAKRINEHVSGGTVGINAL